jgi:hypothetical protein
MMLAPPKQAHVCRAAVSKYCRLGRFAHQLLICLAAITLAGVLTTPRRYDRVDACSAHVASEQLLHIRHTQCVPKAAHCEFWRLPIKRRARPPRRVSSLAAGRTA